MAAGTGGGRVDAVVPFRVIAAAEGTVADPAVKPALADAAGLDGAATGAGPEGGFLTMTGREMVGFLGDGGSTGGSSFFG